jgi:protein O-mannosyl-transferase
MRRDPGSALVCLGLAAAVVIYAGTLSRGLVNYDDPWLYRDNWIVQNPSLATLRIVFLDLSSPQRFVLTPEYLPTRDLSVMLDFAVWGSWYPGFHLTNLALYLASIVLWFRVFVAFGVDRKLAGLALLLWAVHPTHAESVAWLSERKGLLAVLFAGACAAAYARFRRGGGTRWLILATLAAAAAVWSKGTGAFAVASIAVLEVTLPELRVSWRRSVVGIGCVALVAGAAFVPVIMLANDAQVIGDEVHVQPHRLETVLGVHGFYLRLSGLTLRNAVSYPISSNGPSYFDIALGAVGLVVMAGLVLWRRHAASRVSGEVRAGAGFWLVGWLPIGHAVVPLQMIMVADRYMLFPTLGFTLVIATLLARVTAKTTGWILVGVVVLASGLRAFDAQANWRGPISLWERAVVSNPHDGAAWAMYVDALIQGLEEGKDGAVIDAVLDEGLRHSESPRLLHRKALRLLARDRAQALALMRRAAEGGEAIAMSNLALLLLEHRALDEALYWARGGATLRPNAHAQRTLGKVALASGNSEEALRAFEHAYALEPASCPNRLNLVMAQQGLGRGDDALAYLAPCMADPLYTGAVQELLRRGSR